MNVLFFSIGLVVGFLIPVFSFKTLMKSPHFRMGLFKGHHRAWPEEYHLACELDADEQARLQSKVSLNASYGPFSRPN